MKNFTISNAFVLNHCRFPFGDDVVMPPEAPADPARDLGIVIHDCAAQYINSACKQELLLTQDHPVWASAKAWIVANWKETWVSEPAYVWNPETDRARQIGVDIKRAYDAHGRLPGEVAGTLDVRSLEGDTVYVYEFGTGFDVEHKYDQLRLQCLVAARAHGVSRAVGQIVKFGDDAAYPLPPVTFDEFALSTIAGEFALFLSDIEGAEPAPGEHCQRCNLAPVCPAAAPIVQSIIPPEALVRHSWGLTISSPDHAVWLLNHARLVAAAAEAVKEQVKAYVPKDGLTLEDGTVLIEGTRNMPGFAKDKAIALARALGASDEQIESLSYTAVQSSGLRVKKPAAAKATRKKKAA